MKYLYILFFSFSFFSCSEYQKILKNTDVSFKYDQAVNYFNNNDYARSLQLFEGLLDDFVGNPKSEEVYYHYAYCFFYLQDYISSAYHFDRFNKVFINSNKNEEMAFMHVYSFYKQSPRYSLDQLVTNEAIEKLELFIENFPSSVRIPRVNELIFDLNKKIEKKYFEIVKSYYTTGKFKSAIFAINNFLAEFPETQYIDEISFVQLNAYYSLAQNSIEEKMKQRVKEAIFACDDYLMAFPNGDNVEQVKDIHEKLKKLENGL